MGPPTDLPSPPIAEPIPTSLHVACFDDDGRSCDAPARALRRAHRSPAAEFANGQHGLLTDDGVANADTPPSTSQTGNPADRHVRFAARPLEIQFSGRTALACQTTASAD